jgi:hypothetical protein
VPSSDFGFAKVGKQIDVRYVVDTAVEQGKVKKTTE